MIVESGFRGCDSKGRHGPELGQVVWNPLAGVGGAFLVAIPNVLNNPPICYIASLDNLCGPPTTNTTGVVITGETSGNASTMATVPRRAPAPFHRTSRASSTYRGLGRERRPLAGWLSGGWVHLSSPNPATNNLIGSVNNQANGGFEWDCDGALAMIDPVYVYKGAKQPNILGKYPMQRHDDDRPTLWRWNRDGVLAEHRNRRHRRLRCSRRPTV